MLLLRFYNNYNYYLRMLKAIPLLKALFFNNTDATNDSHFSVYTFPNGHGSVVNRCFLQLITQISSLI